MYNYGILTAGVYKVIKNTINGEKTYELTYAYPKFNVPSRIYGNTMSIVSRVWNDYSLGNKSTGILLTGDSGSGKTLCGALISNVAIENDMPVILLTEIEYTIELINFLTNLRGCVLFLDEFGKNMYGELSNRILTMLSDLNNTRKIIIMTENYATSINQFILNRPGRIRYHIDYQKLPKDIFTDYINTHIDNNSFKDDLMELYNKASVFSFDHLQTIVSEHTKYPNDSIDSLLNILNMKILIKKRYFSIVKAVRKSDRKDVELLYYDRRRVLEEDGRSFGCKFFDNRIKDPDYTDENGNSLVPSFTIPIDETYYDEEVGYYCYEVLNKYLVYIRLE